MSKSPDRSAILGIDSETLLDTIDRYCDAMYQRDSRVVIYRAVDGGDDFVLSDQVDAQDNEDSSNPDPHRPASNAGSVDPGLRELLRNVWREGGVQRRPLRRHDNGQIAAWCEQTVFRLPNGDVALLYEDMTERKRREHGIVHSVQTLRRVMDSLHSLVYVVDMETYEVLFLNRKARELYGDVVGKICWESLHTPRSGPCSFCTNPKLVDDSGKPAGTQVWDLHIEASGRWLECRDQAIEWHNGQLVHLSIATDITQRKRRDEELRLAAQAFDTSEGIMITDTDGCIVRVNKAFERITGYTEQEALGANPRIMKSDRNNHRLYHGMWRSLLSSGRWSGELWNRRRNGQDYPTWVSITAVRDEDGAPTHYVAHFQDISERKRFQAHIERQALYDALTDLPNRRLLLDRLQHRLAEARRHGNQGGLLFLDLDDFKDYNDRYGHIMGDAILRETARRIAGSVRQEDTAARFGGDEFVVLLYHLGGNLAEARRHALEVAQKIRYRLTRPMRQQGQRLRVRTSIGIALFPGGANDVDDIIRRADQAMYLAKKEGKNRIRIGP